MNQSEINAFLNGLVEELASIEHERWAHWQQYLHGKGMKQPDGSLILPASLVRRWEIQMATSYKDLSESEKQSDREQVYRYLPLISEEIRKRCSD
jgi:hypothetical protein